MGISKELLYRESGCLPLPQIPGNSCWDVNGKRFFGSSHWKIPGTNGNSEKVVRFPGWDVPNGNSFTIYKFLEFRASFRPLGFWPSAIASTTTTNTAGSHQMGDCTSVHAAVIPLQFWKYS